MKMLKKYILGYVADYPKICKYEKEFKDKKKRNNLYYKVYRELSFKPKNERQEMGTLLKVCLNEVERINMYSMVISVFILYLTAMKDIYIKYAESIIYVFIILMIVVIAFVGTFISRCIFYSKYYTFLLNILENVKENKKSS